MQNTGDAHGSEKNVRACCCKFNHVQCFLKGLKMFFYRFSMFWKLEYCWKCCFLMFSLFHQLSENLRFYNFRTFSGFYHSIVNFLYCCLQMHRAEWIHSWYYPKKKHMENSCFIKMLKTWEKLNFQQNHNFYQISKKLFFLNFIGFQWIAESIVFSSFL